MRCAASVVYAPSMASWTGRWRLLLGLGMVCVGCSSPCKAVADLLRECCAKGPAELRQGCETEAKHLDDKGNSDACQASLDAGVYARCAR